MYNNTFALLLDAQQGHYEPKALFTDLLDAALFGFLHNPKTGELTHQGELYTLLNKYPRKGQLLVGLMSALDASIRERQQKGLCIDVLGEYYEHHFSDALQCLMPWDTCLKMARNAAPGILQYKPATIIHPNCQTGRYLLAAMGIAGTSNVFYGMESNPVLAKIAVLNLWASGAALGEIMLMKPSVSDNFLESYVVSQCPPGIVKIDKKEDSDMWLYLRDNSVIAVDRM